MVSTPKKRVKAEDQLKNEVKSGIISEEEAESKMSTRLAEVAMLETTKTNLISSKDIATFVMFLILVTAVIVLAHSNAEIAFNLEKVQSEIAQLQSRPVPVIDSLDLDSVKRSISQLTDEISKMKAESKQVEANIAVPALNQIARHERDVIRIFGILGKPREFHREER